MTRIFGQRRLPPIPPRLRPVVTFLAVLSVALGVTEARAQSQASSTVATTAREGTVVAIDSGELVVDIGAIKGVHDGDVVELWRPLRVRHPVTGAVLNERFRIGSLRLVQVRGTLSLATMEGTPTRPPATGDYVVIYQAQTPPNAVPARGPVEVPQAATTQVPTVVRIPADPEATVLSGLMKSLEGASPKERVSAYSLFLSAHPKSPYATVLREEARALAAAAEPTPEPYVGSIPSFVRARAGVAQRYALELDARFVGAVLHVRRKGTPAYRSIAMATIGERYWSATLPGDAIAEPGLELFVEGVAKSGNAVAVVATAQEPREIPVETPGADVREPGQLVQVNLQSEIASFNIKKPNDFVFQTEGSVGWRMRDEGIRALRSGFGVLRGKGGSLHQLDELGLPPSSVGLTYGYLEAEIAATRTFSFIGRPIIALRDGGLTGGAQAFVRIGNDLATNLSIGGEVLGTVGQRGIVQLEWRTIPRVPIVLRTEVTNQPAGTRDIGARVIAQIGYQFVRDLTISARVSYQGRTINHAGPGAGLAVSYQW